MVYPTVDILKIAGGNSTALVSYSNNRNIAKQLLKEVEQVGFISNRKIPKLTMMGGELCINATIAFASQLSKRGKLFTSGIKKQIEYENKGSITTIKFPLNYKIKNNIVLFEGIGFIIFNRKYREKISKNYLANLSKKYNLPAFGAIIYEKNRIEPYVYVRKVDSFMKETACGSGSIAFSIFSGLSKIIQPTGKSIKVNIKKDKVIISAEVKNEENKMKTNLVKGFKDITGPVAAKKATIKRIIEDTFQLYNFEPAETPIIEYEEFVKGTNQTDEAVSDIFKLTDRGKRKLALRYEFTFQLKRLMKNQKLPYKRYQIGPVFRDEPIQGNRLRQFTQCDVDTINSTFKDEAEILDLVKNILNSLNLEAEIYINNRKLLNEILEKQKISPANQEAVIREIDKLDKLSEKEIKSNLKKYKAESVLKILKQPESYFKKYKSYEEIKTLKKFCKPYKVKFKFTPSLARGLSYYNGNIFEVKAKGIKETIVGGGSYMFNNTQCTGISFGLDRLALIANPKTKTKKLLIISINQDEKAIQTTQFLRSFGIPCQIFYSKPGKALEYANAKSFSYAILIGEKEFKENKVTLKNLESGKEKLLSVDKVIKELL